MSTKESITRLSLNARILEIIFRVELMRLIGQKSVGSSGAWTFGMRYILGKLILSKFGLPQ